MVFVSEIQRNLIASLNIERVADEPSNTKGNKLKHLDM